MDRYEQAALQAANRALAEVGGGEAERLDPGYPDSATSCPIGRTIKRTNPNLCVEVGDGAIVARSDDCAVEVVLELPVEAERFTERFDRGAYPHLLSPASPAEPGGQGGSRPPSSGPVRASYHATKPSCWATPRLS